MVLHDRQLNTQLVEKRIHGPTSSIGQLPTALRSLYRVTFGSTGEATAGAFPTDFASGIL